MVIFEVSADDVVSHMHQGKARDKVESEMLRVLPQKTNLPYFKDAREFQRANPKCRALTESMKDVGTKKERKIRDALEREVSRSVPIEDTVDAFLDFVEPKLKKLLTRAVQQQVVKKVANAAAQHNAKRKKSAEASQPKKHRKLVTGLSRQSSDPPLDLSPKVLSVQTPTSPEVSTTTDPGSPHVDVNSPAASSSSSSKYTSEWYNSNLGRSVRIYSQKDRRTLQGTLAEYDSTPREAGGKCCLIKYDSGRREWLDLSKAVYEFV